MSAVIQQIGSSITRAVCQPEGNGGGGGGGPASVIGSSIMSGVTGGSNNIPNPGAENGDLVIISSQNRNSVIGTPSGGTSFGSTYYAYDVSVSSIAPAGSQNDRAQIWSKIAGASEPVNYTTSITDEGTNGHVLVCVVVRNATGITSHTAASSNEATSVDGADGGILLSVHGSSFNAEKSPFTPDFMTLLESTYVVGAGCSQYVAYRLLSATEATGVTTWVNGYNGSNFQFVSNIAIS